MSASSNLDRICVAALALAVLIAALAFCAPALGYEAASGGVVLGYEERLFDTSVVHTIDIVMDDWEGFIAGCEDEEYVLCDLVSPARAYAPWATPLSAPLPPMAMTGTASRSSSTTTTAP